MNRRRYQKKMGRKKILKKEGKIMVYISEKLVIITNKNYYAIN